MVAPIRVARGRPGGVAVPPAPSAGEPCTNCLPEPRVALDRFGLFVALSPAEQPDGGSVDRIFVELVEIGVKLHKGEDGLHIGQVAHRGSGTAVGVLALHDSHPVSPSRHCADSSARAQGRKELVPGRAAAPNLSVAARD